MSWVHSCVWSKSVLCTDVKVLKKKNFLRCERVMNYYCLVKWKYNGYTLCFADVKVSWVNIMLYPVCLVMQQCLEYAGVVFYLKQDMKIFTSSVCAGVKVIRAKKITL